MAIQRIGATILMDQRQPVSEKDILTMLNKKKIIIAGVISVFVIGIAFIFLKPEQRIDEEVQEHIDTLYSLTGKLTPDEKNDYFDTSLSLSKMQKPLPQKEVDKINEHFRKLILDNPDLMLGPREFDEKYGHIVGHTHGHPHADELEHEIQKALDQVDGLIAELEASDLPENVKEGLLHIYNHRRESLIRPPDTRGEEMKNKFIEFWKTDPAVTGVSENLFTGEYVPLYPNMISVYRQRTHQTDGTVNDVVKHIVKSATPENESVVEAYLTALETTPPGETPPPPPEFKGLHFNVVYKDVYPKSDEDILDLKKETPTNGTKMQMEMDDSSVTPDVQDPTLIEESNDIDPMDFEDNAFLLKDNVFLLQDTLEDIDDPEMQVEISHFLEEIFAMTFDQFLEMSDAEFKAKIIDSLTPQSSAMSNTTLSESRLEENLLINFSSLRVNRALAAVKQFGPKEGLRQIKEVDPEVAKQLDFLLQDKEREN